MKLYAELPLYRTRQLFFDLFVVAWAAGWVAIGRWITRLVENLAEPGRLIEEAGSDLAGVSSTAGGRVGGVPVIGRYLESPFRSLEQVGRSLVDAGQTQQETVTTLALWLGVLIAGLAILFLLVPWAIRRSGWIREASALSRLRSDASSLHLLALRAISVRPLAELFAACPDPAAAYNAGDYAPLAALELKRMGLTPGRRGVVT